MFIIGDFISSLFWGIVMSMIITSVVFLICILASRRSFYSVEVLMVIGGLFLFNSIICTLIAGALQAKSYTDAVCSFVGDITDASKDVALSEVDFNELKYEISKEYRNAQPILDMIDANGVVKHIKPGSSLASYISDQVNDKIYNHIINCLLWMLGGIITATTAVTLIIQNNPNAKGRNKYSRSMVVQRRPRVNTRKR